MLRRLALLLVLLMPATASAQDKPMCDLLTDAEVEDLFGKPGVKKRSIIGPNDCNWYMMGYSLMVNRLVDEPETARMMVETALTNVRDGDKVQEEAGIGQRAVSTVAWNGRGISLVAASGKTAWTMTYDRVDQKVDVEKALPKLRAIAKKLLAALGGGA